METFYFKIAKDDMSGLCNQMYSFSGCIEYCIGNGIKNLVIGKFLKEVKSRKTCPISDIFDIPKINAYLKKFNVNIIDGSDIYDKDENIFKPSPIPYMGQSNNAKLFIEILNNIHFLEKYYTISKNLTKFDNFNVIHLRLENDAVECFSKELNIDPDVYKTINEYRYIYCIKKYIDKNMMTYVLTSSKNEDNKVLYFLKDNGYNFMITEKYFQDRDINAVIDLLIGSSCTKSFIGSFDSSFSFTIMNRILLKRKQNEAAYLIDCNTYDNNYRTYNYYTYNIYLSSPEIKNMMYFNNVIE
jgi:hypothetical protein